MNLFQSIGRGIDNTLNSISLIFTIEKTKETQHGKRTRISDTELQNIIKSDFKHNKTEQLKALHALGFGVSNVRMAKAWQKVKKEALAQQIQDNIQKV